MVGRRADRHRAERRVFRPRRAWPDAAAEAWYGLPPEALRPEEALALLALARSPSYYDPLCRPGRFNQRFRLLSARLGIADTDAALARARERLRPVACNSPPLPAAALIPFPIHHIAA